MLNARPKDMTITVRHLDSGAKFTLRPLLPAKVIELQRRAPHHKDRTQIDLLKYQALVADYVIVDWEGVGIDDKPIECTAEAKREFGENLAFTLMPWLIEQATELATFITEQETAAKNG